LEGFFAPEEQKKRPPRERRARERLLAVRARVRMRVLNSLSIAGHLLFGAYAQMLSVVFFFVNQ
ncbi:MAG TPA: hypothetical protein VKU40_19535, partial [Thermoanaerobaculia bacterium]|nr:hypothetical protein [Thermoanaerobaculia bacterium]